MNVDSAFDAFNKMLIELKAQEDPETEADTRFQIIDRILRETLGWGTQDFKLESHSSSGYSDYILKDNGRNKLVVEAKRSSKKIVETSKINLGYYKANGPVLKSSYEGMKQAQSYCIDTGLTFAALTNGIQWVGFWAIRENGKSPFDGKAVVFPSLTSIKDNFSEFYDFFSKEGIRDQLFKVRISSAEGLNVISSENLSCVTQPTSINLLKRSALASDIEIIFRKFFSDISGENNLEMLAECFVESKESREAEVGLEKIARNVLDNIGLMESSNGEVLQDKIRASAEEQGKDFVLIVGNKGAGKTTFIDRFFRIVVKNELKEKCLIIRLDLANSDGDEQRINSWLSKYIISELEKSLYGKEGPTYDELQGVFFDDYQRWMRGEHQHLYESNRSQFKIDFGSYMYEIRKSDPYAYALKLLKRVVSSNKKMPCIVLDNTDHYPKTFQERVFQYAQSINRSVCSFIICPITDKTVWQLSKAGPFQSYHTHSFYLPVPQSKDILKKRVGYLRKKIDDELKKDKKDYILNKGLKLHINDLKGFVACIDEIFINTDYVSRTISWLSNHDIRRGLRIAERIITSPIVSMEELISTWATGNKLTLSEMKIRQALLYGNYTMFTQEHSEYILNLFSISAKNITSPLIKPSILRLLMDIKNGASNGEEEYFSLTNIHSYFEPCGVPATVIRGHILELLNYRLIEPYDPTNEEMHDEQRFRITHSGYIHYEFITQGFIYLQNMALVTQIRNHDQVEELKKISNKKMTREDWEKLKSKFVSYLLEEDKIFIHIPNLNEYNSQHLLRKELCEKWVTI